MVTILKECFSIVLTNLENSLECLTRVFNFSKVQGDFKSNTRPYLTNFVLNEKLDHSLSDQIVETDISDAGLVALLDGKLK